MSANQQTELHTIATSPIGASAFELFDPSEAELYVFDLTNTPAVTADLSRGQPSTLHSV